MLKHIFIEFFQLGKQTGYIRLENIVEVIIFILLTKT